MAAAKARPQGEDADDGLALGPPANGNAPHPDAALLALAAEFDLAERKERALPNDLTQDHYDAAWKVCRDIADQIIHTPATTLDGLRAKTRVYLWCGHQPDEEPEDLYAAVTTDVKVAHSIMRDLMRGLSTE
ncbi:hypothetical protein ACIU1J_27680 [Azospirillum doebereinerae]|uniref:hypothetical protein n=1 Tax=Azospirillum doebereinerae TaxID=92933 RepID=UPI001EE5F740|nr:hypothetical protein [Azospirillum doebereinerae]MCG5241401.1 hypothetical protein [Azospirillum doebereinerae]